ncbi:hypothetical protein N7488_004786 [Penicillium malachiteum]|nr:hypothetical protein N7488_004786 [Penicillium malachiteum]
MHETPYYNSAYLADAYESRYCADGRIYDLHLYFNIFSSLLLSHQKTSSNEPFVVLDIGTGTGRVLLGLIERARDTGLDLSDVQLIGMDNSQHMLDVAMKNHRSTTSPPPNWCLGDALALRDLPMLRNPNARAHLVIFAYGGISHLTSDADADKFLAGVSDILHSTGRAIVSLAEMFVLAPGDAEALKNAPPEEPTETPGLKFADVVYRESVIKFEVQGNFCIRTRKLQSVQRVPGGGEIVLEEKIDTTQYLLWTELRYAEWVQGAGLTLVDTKMIPNERLLVMQKCQTE